MRLVLKDLEKAISFIRKNSSDEYISLKYNGFNKCIEIVVSDLSSKLMTIIIHDEETKLTPDIFKSDKL